MYKDLHERKTEAEGKYVTAEREPGDQRKEKEEQPKEGEKSVNGDPVQCIRLDTA